MDRFARMRVRRTGRRRDNRQGERRPQDLPASSPCAPSMTNIPLLSAKVRRFGNRRPGAGDFRQSRHRLLEPENPKPAEQRQHDQDRGNVTSQEDALTIARLERRPGWHCGAKGSCARSRKDTGTSISDEACRAVAAMARQHEEDDHEDIAQGIEANTAGMVWNNSDGPASGWNPKAEHGGKMARPARINTNRSANMTWPCGGMF